MRKIYIILLAVAVALACKKDKEQPPVMEQEANTELDATVDGQKYTPLTAAITPEFYTEPTQSIGALKIQANLNTSKSLVIFIDQLQNGVINLTQSYPAQMGLESHKGNEMKILGDKTGDKILATTLKSYVKYIDATTSYFAISGKITVVIKDKNTLITWEVTFKDSAGKSFVSTGSTTIINYKKNTKSTSQITSPTNALSVAAISPDYAWEGTVVTLTGTGFSAIDTENLILFGGQSVKATKTTTNQLQFTIPYFTNINKPTIEVKVLGKTATLDGFTFLPQIHSFTPAKAPVGNTVQIFGLAFPINAAELVVKFDDVVAEVKENSLMFDV